MGATGIGMNWFCVLVTSSDDRKDIFDTCFAHSERIWKDCDWPRYVGFTTKDNQSEQYGFKVIESRLITRNWCQSVAAHIEELPPEHRYILLMVEDVLFTKPVDGKKLNKVATLACNADIRYLRLVPVTRNWAGRLLEKMVQIGYPRLRLIERREPYYASTEMVLWERNYLLDMLRSGDDAWEFEHQIKEQTHWAVWEPLFEQHQLVQKGRWNRNAVKFLASQGLTLRQTARPFQTRAAQLRGWRENLSFALFGFTSFRIKRWLRSF